MLAQYHHQRPTAAKVRVFAIATTPQSLISPISVSGEELEEAPIHGHEIDEQQACKLRKTPPSRSAEGATKRTSSLSVTLVPRIGLARTPRVPQPHPFRPLTPGQRGISNVPHLNP